VLLKPGEQAEIISGQCSIQSKADVAEATGWRKDLFVFHDADLRHIMDEMSRWYNVEVIFTNEHIPHLFNASISRDEPLAKLLHLLELTGKVHFKINNRKVYVL